MRVAFGVNMFPEYIGYARDKTGLHLELVALVQREGGADNYLIVHPQEFDQFQMGRPHIEMVLEAISRSGMIGGSHEIFIQPTGSTEFLSLPDAYERVEADLARTTQVLKDLECGLP